GEEPERLQLLATYGARGLRRMLTDIFRTLRSAGRPLVLELGDRPPLAERLERLREAAVCLAEDAVATDAQRANAARLLEVVDADSPLDQLLDLSSYRARGERAATYEEARRLVESAALDELATRDRDLLQVLLDAFARSYAAAKERESALDFEDLQLGARDLLRENPEIREREQLRFRAILVDEFQDTNRLQCEIIDLVSRPWREDVGCVAGAAAADGVPVASAASLPGTDVFFVGDEFQSIYGFRHADVQVFRDRRGDAGGGLALSRNYRSRPEVLAAVNFLFRDEFGGDFQPLTASGEFPDPVFGHPVELLVTDKAAYADSGLHWRRAEAKHVAGRVRELIDAGAAHPGEIVLLFAAGTDAEWYEEELRALDVPTYRATGRGYFGQQQVVDLLAYLRLLLNRYDDRALATVLASPFVGVSNDALVLIRRAAGRRPLFAGIERDVPAELGDRDTRLLRAFRQRYDRLTAASSRVSLERLCDQILAEHDYDLAVLTRWDGKRRYANLRKLARLARAYEDLRGPDIEGFVRFVQDQDAIGASELEAVAEEEGADAVRLLTIHAAKGLEFKVVVVADAGRDARAPAPDDIVALSDGRFGFRVADPVTLERRAAFDYDAVRAARRAQDRAERLRLYYVAMTRAVDRLLVSGAIDPTKGGDTSTPIGWVLARLQADDELARADPEPVELERGGARLVVRLDRGRFGADAAEQGEKEREAEPGNADRQLSLFAPDDADPLPRAPKLPALVAPAEPPEHAVRRLSFTALATFERCSYRYYAERILGMRPRDAATVPPRAPGLGGVEIGSAVHAVLERLDLRAPRVPADLTATVQSVFPAAAADELERIRAFVAAYCQSELAARVAALDAVEQEREFAFEHEGVLLHGYLDVLHWAGGRALVVDYKTNSLSECSPEEIVEREYGLQRLVYALACFRAGAAEVEVVYHFLERPDATVASVFSRSDVPALEAELSAAIARIRAGEFRPTPGELTCPDCPALDVVCAGPRLRSTGGRRAAATV
ncbi:MAG: PD-(D/E)XK nuclease family protein, partial [Actinomycetota bacterium]|nr:PD-(D/E)XK nuclease family protein [Actinomycetota bacterium]